MLYTREHFLSVSPGSIDYSPYQPAPIVTIILEEPELRQSMYSQFERFWRVWYKERTTYAPALQTLVLGVRNPVGAASRCDNGIARFIAYFHTDVYPYAEKVGLDVYQLDEELAEPKLLFRIFHGAQTLPAPHTLTSMALHHNG